MSQEGRSRAHGHPGAASSGPLWRAVAVPVLLVVIEGVGGLAGGSMALLSDAGHQATDVFAASMAVFAEKKGRHRPTATQSYGFHRAGILVAALNAVLLLAVAALIVWGAVSRIRHPAPLSPDVMGAAAIIGLALDGWVAVGLWRHGEDLNRRAVLWHVLGDSLSEVGILLAAIAITITGWRILDPLVSLAIAVLLTSGAVSILLRTVRVLMEAVPAGVSPEIVRELLTADGHVKDIHDLHIWSLAPGRDLLTCHLCVDEMPLSEGQVLVDRLSRDLKERFGIEHATIQLESGESCELEASCLPEEPVLTGRSREGRH